MPAGFDDNCWWQMIVLDMAVKEANIGLKIFTNQVTDVMSAVDLSLQKPYYLSWMSFLTPAILVCSSWWSTPSLCYRLEAIFACHAMVKHWESFLGQVAFEQPCSHLRKYLSSEDSSAFGGALFQKIGISGELVYDSVLHTCLSFALHAVWFRSQKDVAETLLTKFRLMGLASEENDMLPLEYTLFPMRVLKFDVEFEMSPEDFCGSEKEKHAVPK